MFWTFWAIFSATAVITILGIIKVVRIDPPFLKWLSIVLLLEVIVAVLALFTTEFSKPNPAAPQETVEQYYSHLNQGNLGLAYQMLSNSFQKNISKKGYKDVFGMWGTGAVTVKSTEVSDEQAKVFLDVVCHDIEGDKENWSGFISLSKEDSKWKIEPMGKTLKEIR